MPDSTPTSSLTSPGCVPQSLAERPLLTPIQAGGLAAVFKVLANDTRLRLLHALARCDELRVTDLAATIAMKPQAVSNQLQRLSDLGIVASRRDSTTIYYRLQDRCVRGLLEQGWCLMEEVGGQSRFHAVPSSCCAEPTVLKRSE